MDEKNKNKITPVHTPKGLYFALKYLYDDKNEKSPFRKGDSEIDLFGEDHSQ